MLSVVPPATWLEDGPSVMRALQQAAKGGWIGVDTETTGLRRMEDEIVLWSFADAHNRWAATRAHLHVFKEFLLTHPQVGLVLHNLPYDAHMFANAGIDLFSLMDPEDLWDSLMLDNLVNPNGAHGLKLLAKDRLGIAQDKYSEKGFGALQVGQELSDELKDYAALDPWLTLQVFFQQIAELTGQRRLSTIPYLPRISAREDGKNAAPTMLEYYVGLEQPLQRVLFRMERRGVSIDIAALDKCGPEIEKRLQALEGAIYAAAQRVVNLRSPKQLVKLLYTDLEYTPPVMRGKKKKTNTPSTDETALMVLEQQRPGVPGLILEFREWDKLHKTYVVGLRERALEGRLHCRYNQSVTATGRLSSADPNLQNIPRAGDPNIRSMFVASPGKVLIVGDYSQVELRVLAHLANARSLIDPFTRGVDLHSLTASRIFGVPYERIVAAKKAHEPNDLDRKLKEYRSVGKTINFGVVYGLSKYGLKANLRKEGIVKTLDECQEYLDAFWRMYPDVKLYFEGMVKFVRKHQWVPVLLGRRRPLSGLDSPSEQTRRETMNQVYNTPVQAAAAEIVKWAMLNAEVSEKMKSLQMDLLLQVHDELVFECPIENEEAAKAALKECMENLGLTLRVPLIADVGSGHAWSEAK